MIELGVGGAAASIDPSSGGRVASLRIDGTEVVVGPEGPGSTRREALHWGIYPMVPFAGRIRGGRFRFRGREHSLDRRAGSHAMHGTVDEAHWTVTESSDAGVSMECALGPTWPFDGRVRHAIALDGSRLRMELELTAHDAMPAQVGWHPWFARPAAVRAEFGAWLPRDADGLPTAPTSAGLPDLAGTVDDCFCDASVVQVEANLVALVLASDCSHWVVYTGADHGICVEPQSGPPNETENAPLVLEPGETLSRWFEIRWGSAGA